MVPQYFRNVSGVFLEWKSFHDIIRTCIISIKEFRNILFRPDAFQIKIMWLPFSSLTSYVTLKLKQMILMFVLFKFVILSILIEGFYLFPFLAVQCPLLVDTPAAATRRCLGASVFLSSGRAERTGPATRIIGGPRRWWSDWVNDIHKHRLIRRGPLETRSSRHTHGTRLPADCHDSARETYTGRGRGGWAMWGTCQAEQWMVPSHRPTVSDNYKTMNGPVHS